LSEPAVSADHPGGDITQLLGQARAGQDQAVGQLCELLYNDLRLIARARLRAHQPMTLLGTTALVHESFLRFAKLGQVQLEDRKHFLAYAARAMSSIIVDTVRRKQAERRGGQVDIVSLDTEGPAADVPCEDEVLRIGEALQGLAKVDARAAQVVELRYFAGLADHEIASVLGVTERTVYRDWRKAKLMLLTALS
jgi:RNA polymerase sigma factor (TIGR02999 family)